MANHDFFLTGDINTAKSLIEQALSSEGLAVTTTPTGGLSAQRGSMFATVMLGALAGKKMHMTFTVDYFQTNEGQMVARLALSTGSAMLKGGAIGISKANQALQTAASRIHAALTNASALTGVIAN